MFIDLLRRRRSIRRFQQKPVEPDKLAILLEAALRAPSSRGLMPWELVVVQDPDMLGRLALAKPHGASFLNKAPLAIVVCAEPTRCDVWIEDCSLVALLLHLAATDIGLGSCWVQIRLRQQASGRMAEEYVSNLLGLKEGLVVEAIMAIGYPAEILAGHQRSSLLDDKVSFERYGQKQ